MKNVKTILLVALVIITAACKTSKYADLEKGMYADIETNKGNIVVKLYFEDLPLTVSNFVSLAEGTNPAVEEAFKGKKYYDGITFHRVMPNFMIQAGDPTGTGSSNPGYTFEDEYPKDDKGVLKYKHDGPGVLSMANYGAGTGTNGSQFFITHKDTPWLDSIHSIFGKVEIGQNVVDSILKGDVMKHITIIRIGSKAKSFDAPKVFEDALKKSKQAKLDRVKDAKEIERLRKVKFQIASKSFNKKMGIEKAKETSSGLKILVLKKGSGKKVDGKLPITVNYTLHTADGTPIDTTIGREPFTFSIAQSLIAGWKEGVLTMRVGGKSRFFIPSYLGWGEKGFQSVPADADLVFEIEVIKVGK
ncbi:MAG: peptidylprolyl isomerase [Flavobacteriaceae bacterium]|nr:peptidylprolyl isomerase [Flavobacteriaceae bacterium]